MTDFSRLLKYVKPYRAIFAFSVVLMILSGLFEGATSLLLVPIFNNLAGQSAVAVGSLALKNYLPAGESGRLIALLLVGFTLAKGITEYFSSYSMSHIGQNVIADVRSSLYDHIIRQSAAFFTKRPTNELTAHLMSDTALVERAISDTLRDLL